MPEHEQRMVHRVKFIARAALRTAKGSVEVQLLDISLKGALVDAPKPDLIPSLESLVVLDLALGDSVELIMNGKVVRHAGGCRIGLAWDGMDVDTASHLHRLLVLNLGDEAAFEADLDVMLAGLDE
ncbi:hypothetical protein BJI67_09170 [Acidihalobacter aeolianus]|uniref:PilZ domain-containing protein n=1 Tax=Acidihalobacter aeolianus TaxID=2792603 RepID=A0A1D8K8A8_9GAMM|nr:PilZ domain-containing protein [Acidihalobacter aeolianus]AOV17209.1 hypothetical protein BJI67_09170 [Acidihalobacter aeolianus]